MPTVLSKICAEEPGHGELHPDKDLPKFNPVEMIAAQGNIFVPYNDEVQGVMLHNGQMYLEVHNWRDRFPQFIMKRNTGDSPKGGLNIQLIDEIIFMKFQIPNNFPDGMIGFMTVLRHLFHDPEKLGMVDISPGSEEVNRETNRAKCHDYYIKWTSPWENFGCRVNWMKKNLDSSRIKFKFSSINKMGCDEEMIVTVDEQNIFFKQISASDPVSIKIHQSCRGSADTPQNLYGQWLALPARIWLRTQWIMRKSGNADNKIFNKLAKSTTTDKPMHKTRRKKEKKHTKQRKASPKATKDSDGVRETSNVEVTEASNCQEESSYKAGDLGGKLCAPEAGYLVLAAGSESVSILGQMKTAETMVETQAVANKSVQSLTIDIKKSNAGWKSENTSGAIGATVEEKHGITQNKPTNRRDDSQGVHTDITHQGVPTEQQLATVAGQTTVHASLSSTIPIVLDSPMTPPFEMARTHLSSPLSLRSTTLSQFFTPIEEEKGGVEVKAEKSEPGEDQTKLRLTPLEEEMEVEFRWPVSGAEMCESGKLSFIILFYPQTSC